MFPCSHFLFPSPSSGNSSCPLIGPPCYVRPVLPTGLAAVFLLDKGERLSAARSAAPPPRGCRRPCTPSTNTARAEGGGIQGGPPPCAGGPGTRRSLAYLCLLSLREKVGRGLGRSAQKGRCRDCQSRKSPRAAEHGRAMLLQNTPTI